MNSCCPSCARTRQKDLSGGEGAKQAVIEFTIHPYTLLVEYVVRVTNSFTPLDRPELVIHKKIHQAQIATVSSQLKNRGPPDLLFALCNYNNQLIKQDEQTLFEQYLLVSQQNSSTFDIQPRTRTSWRARMASHIKRTVNLARVPTARPAAAAAAAF